MTDLDIKRIERALRIKVPADYRALVTNYPPALQGDAENFDLLNDPARVVELNQELRTGTPYGITWPATHFIFGEDGCGDYFCLDLSKPGSAVLFFDHEIQEFVELAPSLDAWRPLLAADLALR